MVVRGCGSSRTQDGVYVCANTGPDGISWETTLVDPAVAWKGTSSLRAPMIIRDNQGISHLCLGVGKTFYPYPSDFFEECKHHGLSKRLPRNFDFSMLTRDSRLLLVHPRAIQDFKYELSKPWCPKEKEETHLCLGDTWALGGLDPDSEKHSVEELAEGYLIKTPSVSYTTHNKVVRTEKPKWRYAIFLMVPGNLMHFEYINRQGMAPSELKRKVQDAGFPLEVCPE